MEERRDCCKTQRPKAPNPLCLPSHSRLFILPPSGVLATMAATAVAARSRALAQAVSSSLLRRSCLPASRRASCINRYAPPPTLPTTRSITLPTSPSRALTLAVRTTAAVHWWALRVAGCPWRQAGCSPRCRSTAPSRRRGCGRPSRLSRGAGAWSPKVRSLLTPYSWKGLRSSIGHLGCEGLGSENRGWLRQVL